MSTKVPGMQHHGDGSAEDLPDMLGQPLPDVGMRSEELVLIGSNLGPHIDEILVGAVQGLGENCVPFVTVTDSEDIIGEDARRDT